MQTRAVTSQCFRHDRRIEGVQLHADTFQEERFLSLLTEAMLTGKGVVVVHYGEYTGTWGDVEALREELEGPTDE